MKRLLLAFVMLVASSLALAAVNLNTATKEELDALPGIGPVKAQAIIDYRTANGPFKSPQDVMKVRGIKEGEYGKIRDQISVSGASTLPPQSAKAERARAATPSNTATAHPPQAPAATPAPASSAAAATPATTSAAAPASASKEAGTTKMTRAEERAAKAKAREEKAAKAKEEKAAKAEKAKEEKAAKAEKAKEEKAAKAEKAKEEKMAKADAHKSKAKSAPTSTSSSNTKQEEKAKQ